MRLYIRILIPLAFCASLLVCLSTTTANAAGTRSLTISGTGADMYPAYDTDITRYGIVTSAGTDGTVSVNAVPADVAGKVFINGVATTGPTEVTGLTPGDEISVIFDDELGRDVHSLIYLPTEFPTLQATNTNGGLTQQAVAVTPNRWTSTTPPSPIFETVVDRWGVPFWTVKQSASSGDLKQQLGKWTVIRQGAVNPGLNVLDDNMETAQTFRPENGPVDGHDSILLPDGGALVMSYPHNQDTGKTDALIEEQNSSKQVVFSWNSKDHVDPDTESVVPPTNPDYAHINSIQILPGDGDILASFRNLSAIFRIARVAHDGYQPGDVIWRFGGKQSDFTFEAGEDGPCAQHSATLHPDGHLVLFDNSPNGFWGNLCVDQSDPSGPGYFRTQTRVTDYVLDEDTMQATLASEYTRSGYAAGFAGSAFRLDNGNYLIGWGGEKKSMAQEVDASGNLVWDLQDTAVDTTDRYSTYRAHAGTWADTTAPVITTSLASGQTFTQGSQAELTTTCTDRGGSALTQCGANGTSTQTLDTTTLGNHSLEVQAKDLAGNQTSQTFTWRVIASGSPVLSVKKPKGNADLMGVAGGAKAVRGKKFRVVVELTNSSMGTDVIRLKSGPNNARIQKTWRTLGKNVTRPVHKGNWKSRALAPGESQRLTIVIKTKRSAKIGKSIPVRLTATSSYTGETLVKVLQVTPTKATRKR
jgi:hypothetical protein